MENIMKNRKTESVNAILSIIDWGLPLPLHIAQLIFSKLSIINLPVCRSVCKSWNLLVLDYAASPLLKLHPPNAIFLSTCDRKPTSTPPLTRFLNPKIYCFDIDTLSFVASTVVDPDAGFIEIYNYCNGLVYIAKYLANNQIWPGIFNPMTHEFFPIYSGGLKRDFFQGFGFSPKTQQYKLFEVHKSNGVVKILRFRRNFYLWTFTFMPSPIYFICHGVYMNGVIYWIGRQKNKKGCFIYALDVETENFEVCGVLKFGFGVVKATYSVTLQVFNGTIYAIFCSIKPAFQIELWRMQDKNSWIRDYIVPMNFVNRVTFQEAPLRLIKVSDDGNILVQINTKLVWLKSGRMIERDDGIRTLIPYRRQFTNYCIYPIESLHFGSLPNILGMTGLS